MISSSKSSSSIRSLDIQVLTLAKHYFSSHNKNNNNNNNNNNIRQLAQIFAQTITTGLIHKTFTCNSIIKAYSNSPKPIQAILIYNHFITATPPNFITATLFPDNYTYPALLNACTHIPSLPKAKEIHAHVTKLGLLHSDTFIQNSFIHLYGCFTQLKDARQLFDEMTERDLVSWNSILGTFSATRPGGSFIHEPMLLFKEMLYIGVQPDRITLIILLSACCWSLVKGLLEYGRVIHAYVIKFGILCGFGLENSLLSLYSKGADMNSSLRLFLEMVKGRRDVASYTIMINGYAELGLINQAKEIFDQMGTVKDVISWNSMINGYVKAKRPEEAFELFVKMEMDNVVNPDENTIVSLLSACASLSDLRLGRLVHQFILQRRIKKDVFVGTALINMYAKCGSLEEAMITFYKLENKDVYAWTTVITALANYGLGKEALTLFREMEKEGIKPNEATFVAVLTACSQSGLVEEGCRLFDNVVTGTYGIQPRIEHFGCLIDLLSRAGLLCEAEKFIRAMPVAERIIAYKILLGACISHVDIDLGENVAKELIKLGPHNHEVYVLLSNFYALANRWDEVVMMRKTIKELDMRKEVGISFIEVKNLRP